MNGKERLHTVLRHLQTECYSKLNPRYGRFLDLSNHQLSLHNTSCLPSCKGDVSCLSNIQRKFFDDNGYVVIKRLVDGYTLDLCRDHFISICNGNHPANGINLMKEPTLAKSKARGEHLYYKMQDLLYDDIFSLYTKHPKLLDYVQCFTGPNITAIHSMLINKPANASSTTEHPLHQDLLYFPFRPANRIVGTWTAMEKIDSENGCLVVLPGSHQSGFIHAHSSNVSQTGAYKTFFSVQDVVEPGQLVHLHMDKGDTVFLHPLLIHGSGPNVSKRFRKAISCHYAASDCDVIDNIQNTVHDGIAKEIEALTSKKGINIDFITAMKLRCMVVRGSEGFTS